MAGVYQDRDLRTMHGVPRAGSRCVRQSGRLEIGLRFGHRYRMIQRTLTVTSPGRDASGRRWLGLGSILGFLGVGFGAFGAHALKARLSPELLTIFETGVRYQMYHALALLATAALMSRSEGRAVIVAGWSFTAGILIFSGSLYALALTGVTILGAVTPIGGLAFLIGWAALTIAAF